MAPFTANHITSEHPTIFDRQIRKCWLSNSTHHFWTPFSINTPRTILFTYHDKCKVQLLLEEQHTIALRTNATEWCAPIVVPPKKNTDHIQMCVDLSHLNCYVHREWYQSFTPAQAVVDTATTNAKYVLHHVGHFEKAIISTPYIKKLTPHHL